MDEQALASALADAGIGAPVHALGQVRSTMDEAAALAASGAPDFTVVVADHQTAGRGRFRRPWVDAPGTSLLVSILFRPRAAVEAWPALPRGVALAAADAVGAQLPPGREARLKWPNDVVVGGAKIGGLLAEGRPEPEGAGGTLVVGLGLNVHQTADALPPGATSLRLCGAPSAGRMDLALGLLRALALYRARIEAGDDLLAPWSARLETLGRQVQAQTRSGAIHGLAAGVDPRGGLEIERADGTRIVVHAADVTLADAPPPESE